MVGEGVVVEEHSSKLDRLVHTLGRCIGIHKGWRLSFLLRYNVIVWVASLKTS